MNGWVWDGTGLALAVIALSTGSAIGGFKAKRIYVYAASMVLFGSLLSRWIDPVGLLTFEVVGVGVVMSVVVLVGWALGWLIGKEVNRT